MVITARLQKRPQLRAVVTKPQSGGGYSEGYEAGKEAGYQDGYKAGHTEGESTGYGHGYEVGSEEGYNRGYDQGYAKGETAGYNRGQTDGYNTGHSMGYAEGWDAGYARGYDEGYAKGKADVEASNALILTDINTALTDKGAETAENLQDVPQRIDSIEAGGGVDDLPLGYCKVDPSWTNFAYFCAGGKYGLGENLKYSDTANGVNFSYMFQEWNTGAHIVPSLDVRKGQTFTAMFAWSYGIVEIGEMDISNATVVNSMFNYCNNLERVSFVKGCIKISIGFAHSSKLDDVSIQSIIDGLADLTGKTAQTLTLHATVGAKLTDEQKATISAKNWTLAY